VEVGSRKQWGEGIAMSRHSAEERRGDGDKTGERKGRGEFKGPGVA
jgi:hypothetical protein